MLQTGKGAEWPADMITGMRPLVFCAIRPEGDRSRNGKGKGRAERWAAVRRRSGGRAAPAGSPAR